MSQLIKLEGSKRKKPEEDRSLPVNVQNVPAFLTKSYEILNDPENFKVIRWNMEGDAFIVRKPNDFAEQILPKYFKHSNYASFVRQLNMYDFHKAKEKNNEQSFSHPLFRRAQKELLKDIKRKTKDEIAPITSLGGISHKKETQRQIIQAVPIKLINP